MRLKHWSLLALAFTATFICTPRTQRKTQPVQPVTTKSKTEKKVIVFDVGQVLLTHDLSLARKHLGTQKLIAYTTLDWKNPQKLKTVLYNLLNRIADEQNETVMDPYGDCVPFHFYRVLTGRHSEAAVLKEVCDIIKNNEDHFCSKREQELCHKMAALMFDPATLGSVQKEMKDGIKLLDGCKNTGHHVIIFSNYGKLAFEQLRRNFPAVFSGIPEENIIVSAHIGAAKPETAAYQHLVKRIQTLGITPSQQTCFFIDNRHENIKAAERHSFTTALVTNGNFKAAKRMLHDHGVLKKNA